ncbi:MAG TPA: AI-2E family transporter [Actinomycetota bacterium]|nr:AI-2E family transporter [Actinomycetota bacterium]
MAARREGPSTATIFRVVFTAAAALTIVSLLLTGVFLARKLLVLVLVAAFLSVGLDPAIHKLQSWRLTRGQSIGLMLLLLVLVFVGFLAAVVPPLIEQIGLFATNLPDYVQQLAEKNPRVEEFVNDRDIAARLGEATSNLPATVGGSAGKVLGAAGSVIASLFNSITVIVLTVYFSARLDAIKAGTLRLVPSSKRDRFQQLLDPILTKIGGYIAGNLVISVIAGIVSFIFLIIAGVPFPVALALWVAIADLIPLVGATLGAVPAVLVAFFSSLPLGIATLIFFFLYQQFENYVIAPRVMTKAVDLSPAAVLVAALAGGSLLGVVGVLMAIPAAAALKLLAQELVIPRMEEV